MQAKAVHNSRCTFDYQCNFYQILIGSKLANK